MAKAKSKTKAQQDQEDQDLAPVWPDPPVESLGGTAKTISGGHYLKELARLEKAATKNKATDADRSKAKTARIGLKPYFDQIAVLELELAPSEQIKTKLSAARVMFRSLTNTFVDEMKKRCAEFSADEKQALVLELFSQDLQAGLNGAIRDKGQDLVRLVENLWDKYHVPLVSIKSVRDNAGYNLDNILNILGYS